MRLYSQLILNLPYPTASFAGKTVIVTGSNVGLGKEAAHHIARLQADNLILAVRNLDAGAAAKADIVKSTGCPEQSIQVWKLDMASYDSVIAFAKRADRELPRLDVVLANAGVALMHWETAEDNERTITINVVSTFLLALLLAPKMKATAKEFGTRPVLGITSSEVHAWTDLPERSAPHGQIFDTLNDPQKSDIGKRYATSKLLEVLSVRAFAERQPTPIVVNAINPGLCHSSLSRNATGAMGIIMGTMKFLLARSTEHGSRTLVHAATAGSQTHGMYLSDCQISPPSEFVLSDEGRKAQDRVWNELVQKLESIVPGISKNI